MLPGKHLSQVLLLLLGMLHLVPVVLCSQGVHEGLVLPQLLLSSQQGGLLGHSMGSGMWLGHDTLQRGLLCQGDILHKGDTSAPLLAHQVYYIAATTARQQLSMHELPCDAAITARGHQHRPDRGWGALRTGLGTRAASVPGLLAPGRPAPCHI